MVGLMHSRLASIRSLYFISFGRVILSSSSSFTISYYQSTIGLARAPVKWGINVGLAVSIILLVLLTFIELTNPRFGTLGRRLSCLRDRYSLLTANLLLIFMGLVITRIVMIIAG
jgi:hypothetical protein